MSYGNKMFCVYNTLSNYNTAESASKMQSSGINPPIPAGTPSSKIQVVPVYGGIGYESLTHDGRINYGGHFNITNAYPNYKNNCTKFVKRLCADDVL